MVAIFQVEKVPEDLDPTIRPVGIDIDLSSFAMGTDGTVVENSLSEKSSIKVKNIQNMLSKAKKDSNNGRKFRDKLDKAYERIDN